MAFLDRLRERQRGRVCERQQKTSDVSDSPGVKGSAGEQGAVVVVTDEVRRRRGAIAGGGLADGADVHLVLGVPYVQQEDVIHQHGVRRNHATYREEQASLARVSRGGRGPEEGRRAHLSRCSHRPGVEGW